MKRFAFTMLELVFVIIVIGILAVLAMPNFTTNPLQQAAEQVANHIRYTQHLAMVDDKFDPTDPTWYIERWQIRFRRHSNNSVYAIFSDENQLKNINGDEPAIDPLTKLKMDGLNGWSNGNLTETFDIKGDDYGIVQSCFHDDASVVASNRGVFAFDHLGRPYWGVSNANSPQQYLMTNDCNLTLTNNTGQSAVITVRPETGYVSVSY